MSNVAIRVKDLGKKYYIGGPQEKYQTFRNALTNAAIAPFKRASDIMRGQAYGASSFKEEIWALKNLSFEVKHGDVVGIIGRNGAGKSTLLKILSCITEPSTGYADIYGRVGALLEVGTGFHPELTGRENVYLNAAILGMGHKEIDRKFDEIVDFAGVEKFIDTPVKHYSSGMGLRLGFAVAAYMEPEILIVDEVLAVGDAEFQKKCLGKMSDVAGEGRTVLFVSHNMGAVLRLCKKGIVLSSGEVAFNGSAYDAVDSYMSLVERSSSKIIEAVDTPFYISSVRVLNDQGEEAYRFASLSSVNIEITTVLKEKLPPTHINATIYYNGAILFRSLDTDNPQSAWRDRPVGVFIYKLNIDSKLLKAGTYDISLDVSVKPSTILHKIDNAVSFELYDPEGDFDKSWSEKREGFIKAPSKWLMEDT